MIDLQQFGAKTYDLGPLRLTRIVDRSTRCAGLSVGVFFWFLELGPHGIREVQFAVGERGVRITPSP